MDIPFFILPGFVPTQLERVRTHIVELIEKIQADAHKNRGLHTSDDINLLVNVSVTGMDNTIIVCTNNNNLQNINQEFPKNPLHKRKQSKILQYILWLAKIIEWLNLNIESIVALAELLLKQFG